MSNQLEKSKLRLLKRLRKEIGDTAVLNAMERVPRESFVPKSGFHLSYEDIPLPIGEAQTISQPYIVALMISALELQPTSKVLEIGTGSGYQAAILSELADKVVTVERIKSLARFAKSNLQSVGCSNVQVNLATSHLGWPPEAPYNAIVVAAAAPKIPPGLMNQLVVGGRLIIPVGTKETQELLKVSKTHDGFSFRTLGPCRFVPLVGKEGWAGENPKTIEGFC